MNDSTINIHVLFHLLCYLLSSTIVILIIDMSTTKDNACKIQRETPCMGIISSSTTGLKPTSKSLKTRQKPSKTKSISVAENSHTPVSEGEDTSRQQINCVTPPGDCIGPISHIPVRKKKKTKSKTKHFKMMKIPSSDDKDTKISVNFPTDGNIISGDETCPVVADSSALVPVNMGSSWKEN